MEASALNDFLSIFDDLFSCVADEFLNRFHSFTTFVKPTSKYRIKQQ
jgi:hypothetical protein